MDDKLKRDIKSFSYFELSEVLSGLGFKEYKAKQIFKWLSKGVICFDEMTDISKEHRKLLSEGFFISHIGIEKKQISRDGTVKYLFSLGDGELIEAVVMSYKHGYTLCLSTQVGCRMSCAFCATAKGGFKRNLSPGEMLSQIHTVEKDLHIKILNIVLMGMGEPLDNYDNVMIFLDIVCSPLGMDFSARHITVSTCGLVDKIYALSDKKLGLTLSISLHATTDDLRNEIMPVNKKFPIKKLIQASAHYAEKTGRRITFEYALINHKNDSEQDAKQLAQLVKNILCHVNLIPINEVCGSEYKRASNQSVERFKEILESYHIPVTVRRTLGSDIDASCGQLRAKKVNELIEKEV